VRRGLLTPETNGKGGRNPYQVFTAEQVRAAKLSENFGAIGWALTPDQVQRLDKASRVIPTYPYWHQEGFAERNPFPTL
jgi:diketogulonate reductase-like aldo/keto reductase